MQDLINKIIEIENSAQEITRQAKQQQQSLPQQLDEEISSMRARLHKEAQGRLGRIEQTEKEAADKALSEVRSRFQAALNSIDAAKCSHQQQWEEEIFRQIIS